MLLGVATAIYWVSILLALLNYGAADLLIVTLFIFPIFIVLIALLLTREIPTHAVSTFHVTVAILIWSAAWIAFQTLPLPWGLFAHPAWLEVSSLSPDVRGTISVSPADDRAGYLRIAAPLGVFLCGLFLFSTDERARRALVVIAVAGGAVAFCSVLQFVLSPDTLLFRRKTAYLDSLTGPFVNRNTAATFFGILVLLEVVLVQRCLKSMEFRQISARLEKARKLSPKLRRQVAATSLFSLFLLLCLVALLLTKSRAGISATFAAVVLLAALKVYTRTLRRPDPSRNLASVRLKVAIFTASVAVIVLFLVMFGGQVLWRAEVRGFDNSRFCVLPGIWAAVFDHFPQGTGLSSFGEIFPAYRDYRCGINGVWDMAHNFYIEGLLTLGLGFVVALLVVVTWLLRIFVHGLMYRHNFRFGAEVGLASLVLVAIHSAFDFSLQISGFAIFYAALLAPITSLSLREPGRRRAPQAGKR